MKDVAVNHLAVERIAGGWPNRASVRSGRFYVEMDADVWDPSIPDFPLALVPFAQHPTFLGATPEQRQAVLTLAWLVYNERVITAEDRVANPAFELVQRGILPGADGPAFHDVIQQALIDEHWHSHIHHVAMRRTVKLRNIDTSKVSFPFSVTFRSLLREQAAAVGWERDLLTVVWTVVSEISINALLATLARDHTIQPLHRMITAMHAEDEDFHGAAMVEITKALWLKMTAHQRDCFVDALPRALTAFAAQDYGAWEVIVDHVRLAGGREMVADCAAGTVDRPLLRDYTGLEFLVNTLGIGDKVSFDFRPSARDRDESCA